MKNNVAATVSVGKQYDVVFGRNLTQNIPEALGSDCRKILIVHSPRLGRIAGQLRETLEKTFPQVLLAEVPDAEAGKRVEVAAFCWQVLAQADFSRTDAIIGLGGGAVTDLAGFVAATWLRGVQVIHVPTSVLGMVDAAIGGKTGINIAEGKNLVGCFHAPAAVFCDTSLLATLPRNELLSGFAEVIKCGFIACPQILDTIEADVQTATNPKSEEFATLLRLATNVKAQVVANDFREAGRREILNYGHTLAHAIERAERYQWRHGVAVGIGMVYAAELACLAGSLPTPVVTRHRNILESLGLPTGYPGNRWAELLATMQRDKKVRAGMLRFIVLDDIAKPRVLAGVDESLLHMAFQAIAQ